MDLFDSNENLKQNAPLADRMRPVNLKEFFGQEHLVGEHKILRRLIESDLLPSLIFWGPPGTGKTTLAQIIANLTRSNFVAISAVTSGVSQVKEIVTQAKEKQKFHGEKTILFIDEIHRFNKTQQDALLPHVEDGSLTLIGATTENPSFSINSALLSRVRVFVLESLSEVSLEKIIKTANEDKIYGLGEAEIKLKNSVTKYLAMLSGGDARTALNVLETASQLLDEKKEITKEIIHEALQKTNLLYDRQGEQHYNLISALHKSLRGSDADAALYWLMRMFESGEDPLYIARRLIRFASEDIGLANSQALVQAVAGYQACQFLGRPECDVHLAQVTVYLARCKKSNELYEALNSIKKDIETSPAEMVPIHLRNAPTKFLKDLGYGKNYKYNPAFPTPVNQDYLPTRLRHKKWLKE